MDLEALRYLYLRRVVGTALGAIGVAAADRLGRRVGRGVFELQTQGRRRAEARVRDWLSESGHDRKATNIVRGMYENAGRFWIEALFARRLLREMSWRRFVDVHDDAELTALAESGRGCLLATLYYGNVGALACALGNVFRPVHVVADALVHPALQAWQRDLYSHGAVRVVDRRSAASRLPRLLESGAAVLMILESERRGGRAVETNLLGRVMRLYPTLGRLSKWLRVPIAAVTCTRLEEPFHFDVSVAGMFEVDVESDEDQVVRKVALSLQRAVASRPEQYLWSLPTLSEPRGIMETCRASLWPVTGQRGAEPELLAAGAGI